MSNVATQLTFPIFGRKRIRVYTPERLEKKRAQEKAWRVENRDQLRQKDKDKYRKNERAVRERSRLRFEENKTEILAHQSRVSREKRDANRPTVLERLRLLKALRKPLIAQRKKEWRRGYSKRRWAEDPQYRLSRILRNRMANALRRQKAQKAKHKLELIGCSIERLKAHIESLFLAAMTWENYGLWEIDHVRPIVSFDLLDVNQQVVCFHFSNLQPLWKLDNQKKGGRFVPNER